MNRSECYKWQKEKVAIKNLNFTLLKLVEEKGQRISETARELELAEQTLHNRVKKYRNEAESGFVGSGNLKPEDKKSAPTCYSKTAAN
ncbi:transposase [Gracilibacillus boraciitolerans]|uniref:transposase n=1 Tax=Gracilibacillus boraciitolerans TaxID=307521 RepID=UPI0034E213BC